MIPIPEFLGDTLRDDVRPRLVGEGIWSVLPEEAEEVDFDRLGPTYDRLARTRLYIRLVSGADPADFTEFAREAIAAADDGGLLDVACGSLTFTDQVYARSPRPVVLVDRSITMLRMGRERLAIRGGNPQIVLLHADGLDLIEELTTQLADVTGGQERLANEQARYAIQFREDLAELADRLRRPGSV